MKNKLSLFVCLMIAVLSQNGCVLLAAGAAGAGTAKWMSDKVMQEVDKPMPKVVGAVKDVLKDLKINLTKETVASEVTQLLAKYPDGRQVWVDVRVVNADHSRVDVRVGRIEGTKDAQDILGRIVKKSESWF